VVRQSWRDVAFLHWRLDPDALRPHLPPGLEPDLMDGAAWITLTPFRVEGFRVLGSPILPGVSSFEETNLRTYVRHAAGTEGLWFLSLDVSSALTAVFGRLAAPYHLARLSVTVDGGRVRYQCERRLSGPARHDLTVEVLPEPPSDPSDLVDRLTGRWRAFSGARGRVVATIPVQHEPWPLQAARLVDLDETIVTATGLPAPTGQPLVHFSPGVDARLGAPQPIPSLRRLRRRSSA
jgi:uncharacterized protein YqjF (DUF2071 family)